MFNCIASGVKSPRSSPIPFGGRTSPLGKKMMESINQTATRVFSTRNTLNDARNIILLWVSEMTFHDSENRSSEKIKQFAEILSQEMPAFPENTFQTTISAIKIKKIEEVVIKNLNLPENAFTDHFERGISFEINRFGRILFTKGDLQAIACVSTLKTKYMNIQNEDSLNASQQDVSQRVLNCTSPFYFRMLNY